MLEAMRATLRYALYTCAGEAGEIAGKMGVSRSAVRRLLHGGGLAFPSYGRVLAWCQTFGFEQAHPEQAALSLLVSSFPVEQRQPMRESVARWMKHKTLKAGQSLPVWLDDELKAQRMIHRRRRRRNAREWR
jgi:transcriptional regulator with XRE-family HTH domain